MEALDQQREFEEQRRTGLGATDTPKILGLSRYGTALTVYDSKVNAVPEHQPSLPAWLGLQLQGTVAQLYRTATGNVVRADNKHHVHRQHPWLVCHLDFRVRGKPHTLMECKTRAYMKGWGDDGSTDIPPDVWAQVQHEMLVTGAVECHVAVLFGHHTFRVYPIHRDEDFHTALVPRLEEFWFQHVLARVPPNPSSHPSDRALLGRLHPSDDGDLLSATPEQGQLVHSLQTAMKAAALAQEDVEEVKNRIKAALGDHAGWITPYGTVTWKKTADIRKVEWRKVATELAKEVDSEYYDNVLTELAAEHTNISPGVRRFLYERSEV